MRWTLRYIVVDTRNWLPGKKVLLSPSWIGSVDWGSRRVGVRLTQAKVKESPEYDPTAAINREYEVELYDFYGRSKYWECTGNRQSAVSVGFLEIRLRSCARRPTADR